jgi:signal transduction histidine kinase
MTDNFRHHARRRSIVQAGWAEESGEGERLRASLRRLVLCADADRRAFERDLHDGVQQHLVALSVAVQLATQAAESDPASARALLEELARDVQHALEATALLAQRIYPATLEAGGLAVLLRAAASEAGGDASVDVAAGAGVPAAVAMTVYLCWLDALGRAGDGTRATIKVRESEDALDFEVVADRAHPAGGPDWLRDRVEALGGWVATTRPTGGGVSVSGSLPLGR